VVHFSGRRRETSETTRPTPSKRDTKRDAEVAKESNGGPPTAPRPVNGTAFRFSLRTVLRPGFRASRSETLAWKRDRRWVKGVGSFEDLEREVNRSRRFGHAFFLARIPCPRGSGEADSWRERTLALLISLVRNVDTVWSDGKDVYLLLPESDRGMGTAALARIREPLSRVLGREELETISFVVFAPDECPTSRALLAALHPRARTAETRPVDPRGHAARRFVDPDGAGG
jgi:hypothetical protein